MNNVLFRFAPLSLRAMALAAFLSLGMSSCDVTDLEPKDAITESAAFTTPERIALAVTGVYNAAQSGFYDPLNGGALQTRGYPFGSAATEFGDVRGEDVVDMAGFFGIVYSNVQTPSSPNVVGMWSNLYALINQCNVVIEGVRAAQQRGTIDQATAAAYEGECRYLRALAYHELLLHFARPFSDNNGSSLGVPYRDFAVNTSATLERAKTAGRNTVAEVYTGMLADLDFAEQSLPTTRTGNLRVTRVTKGAAIALKQRLRQHQQNWAAAKAEGDKLVAVSTAAPGGFSSPLGGYQLQATPQAAFPGGTSVTAENIFSIENSSDDNPGVNGALPNFFGSPATAPVGVQGRGLIAISPILFNASFWPCNDLRRTQLLQPNNATPARYHSFKYKDAATNTDFAPISRYAEVLLNQAEAEARLGNSVRAVALLNAVRGRAVQAADLYPVTLTGDALVQAILNERRIELLAEGFRWDDIHRLSPTSFSPRATGGIPAKAGNAQSVVANYACGTSPALTPSVSAIPYSDYRFLWPIPAIEVANNPVLAAQQNPGY
ncbi:RagB/SusD family nutrient uptake outer membrane protein [Hymenobacter latericus]|uniref:RagB/SusD family nutrient uptake outer membrane protein n=1 Tax=Hymenobacter sp. YIM 151858-1 TaxID=2987688 RepID=UPI002226BC45|nr:RagB/SusD family nutrient uptake outer membrane protein [Hymenobacter sp. YIM 151858-1]UYZ59226.1 RagB/SusD family nutrient uptake outer membrane protein [Hymenobacter sp. YIM 151858-1]